MIVNEAELEAFVERIVRRVLKDELATMGDETLTKEEVARMLHVSTRTVTTYMKREGMPHTHRGGRALFQRSEVLAWWRNQGKVVRLKAV